MANKINEIISSLPFYDLKAMANELVEFKNTGILCDGKVRSLTREIQVILNGLDYGSSLSVTRGALADEIIERFARNIYDKK